MKKLLIILTLLPLLTSCGDFFLFEQEPDDWEGVTMKIDFRDAYLMAGDTLPLTATFTPKNPNESPIYWFASSDDSECFKVFNDSLVGLSSGTVSVRASAGGGMVSDIANVTIIDKWEDPGFQTLFPYDMVFYAEVTVDGEAFDDSTMMLGAYVFGELRGIGCMKTAFDINYIELRVWADSESMQGNVLFKCYDRTSHKFLECEDRVEYSAYTTYGTLSNLYPITFKSNDNEEDL